MPLLRIEINWAGESIGNLRIRMERHWAHSKAEAEHQKTHCATSVLMAERETGKAMVRNFIARRGGQATGPSPMGQLSHGVGQPRSVDHQADHRTQTLTPR